VAPAGGPNAPAFKSAQKACQGILPGPSGVNPAEQAQQQHVREQEFLAFAKCMRSHKVSDFPDPTSTGRFTRQMLSAAGVDVRAPFVQAAAMTCLPAAGGAITAANVRAAATGGQ
jgi:hypothetical protein